MKKLLLMTLALLAVVACSATVLAADLPRVMIVGEDVDRDTIPRDSRVFKRVMGAIANSMIEEGFDVKDETALTLDTHVQGRSRRDDAELIGIARDAGIDVLVIFSIYPNVKETKTGIRGTARVEGRLLKTYSGKRLGNFEAEPQRSFPLAAKYNRNDVLEGIGSISKVVGTEVGDLLAKRLATFVDQEGGDINEWELVFDGLNASEMTDFEEYLTMFTGYDRHSVKKNAINTSTHHEFFYYSSVDSAQLKRNLEKASKKLGIEVRVYMQGNLAKVVKAKGMRARKAMDQQSW